MNDYVPRTELSPADRAALTSPVPAANGATRFGPEADARRNAAGKANPAKGADLAAASEEQLASAAEYARVHARIADILAGLRAESAPSAPNISATEADIVSLLPAPVIIVPLPPASKDMVERAAQLAKAMAENQVHSRAAQAHVKAGTVDQILAAVA